MKPSRSVAGELTVAELGRASIMHLDQQHSRLLSKYAARLGVHIHVPLQFDETCCQDCAWAWA